MPHERPRALRGPEQLNVNVMAFFPEFMDNRQTQRRRVTRLRMDKYADFHKKPFFKAKME
jgi:hypothetical protein